MNPDDLPAAIVGGATGVVAVVGAMLMAGRVGRRWAAPEIAAAIVVGAALATGAGGFASAALGRTLPLLVMIALLGTVGRRMTGDRGIGMAAVTGAVSVGALPTAMALVGSCRDARQAARMVLLCTGVGAASPLGGPVQILLGGWGPYIWWAIVPGLAAAAVAWPGWGDITDRGPSRYTAPRLLRLAFAVWLIGIAVQVSGAARWIGSWIEAVAEHGPVALFGAGLAVGAVVEPWTAAASLEQALHVGFVETGTALPLTLGLAMCPVLPLAMAAHVHGRGVWRHALVPGALQLAIAAAWVSWV